MPARSVRPAPVGAFLLTGLWLTLLLGSSTGAWTLYRLSTGGATLASHRQLHGHVQVLGFAALVVLGVSLRIFPRGLGDRGPSPALAWGVLAGIGGGVLLRAFGQPLAPWPAGRLLSLASGALELGGALAYASWALPRSWPRRGRAGGPLDLPLTAGVAWLLVTCGIAAAQALWLSGHAETQVPAALEEPLYAAGLYGFLLSFAFGFGSRMLPALLGVPSRPRTLLPVLAAQNVGVLLLVVPLPVAFSERAAAAASSAGAALVAIAALVFLAERGLPGRGSWRAMPAGGLRLATGFLVLWILVTLASSGAELASGRAVSPLVRDGARHLFTIGFLVLLVMSVSARVVPALLARPLARPRVHAASVIMVAAGTLLRSLQIPVALGLGGLPLYRLAGLSGFVVLAGLAGFAWVLHATLRARAATGPKG